MQEKIKAIKMPREIKTFIGKVETSWALTDEYCLLGRESAREV